MIKYSLKCEDNHSFEGWFKNSEDFDIQKSSNMVSCPICNSVSVEKQVMAPNISPSNRKENIKKQISKLKKYIDQNFENVGDNFAEEIIDIHNGSAENRPIQGKINAEDAKKLNELELPYMVIPNYKEDA